MIGLTFSNEDADDVRAANVARGPDPDDRNAWRALPISGYSRYRVSADGQVLSLIGLRALPKRMTRIIIAGTDHPGVALTLDGGGVQKSGKLRLDTLVAGAWCDRPEGRAMTELGLLHRDSNPDNCVASNLLWVTETMLHGLEDPPPAPLGERYRRAQTGIPSIDARLLVRTDGRLWLGRTLSRPTSTRQRVVALDITGGHWVETYTDSDGYETAAFGVPGKRSNYIRGVHLIVGQAQGRTVPRSEPAVPSHRPR